MLRRKQRTSGPSWTASGGAWWPWPQWAMDLVLHKALLDRWEQHLFRKKKKNPLFLQHLIKFLFGSLYASNITSASKINWISCLRKMNIYQKCCTLNFHQSYFPLLQVIGGFCALIGVFILALPVPIVVNRSDNSLEPPTLSPELVSNDSFHSLMSAVESNAKSKFRFYFQFLVCWANIWN